MSFERITTEYYIVPKTNELMELLCTYKKMNNTCCSLNDRQLIFYIVNKAIENDVGLYTGEVVFEIKKNIKLKKTRLIKNHFASISQEYEKYGARISQRQYFHRLILGYLKSNIDRCIESIENE